MFKCDKKVNIFNYMFFSRKFTFFYVNCTVLYVFTKLHGFVRLKNRKFYGFYDFLLKCAVLCTFFFKGALATLHFSLSPFPVQINEGEGGDVFSILEKLYNNNKTPRSPQIQAAILAVISHSTATLLYFSSNFSSGDEGAETEKENQSLLSLALTAREYR